MMKNIVAVILAFITIVLTHSAGADESCFPLNTGDARYISSRNEYIGNKVTINAIEYYEVYVQSQFSHYARVDGENNVYLKYPDRDESLYLRLDASPGDSWYHQYSDVRRDFITFVSSNEAVETDAGTFDGCLHFSFKPAAIVNDDGTITVAVDADYSLWFAPGVGLVKTRSDDWNIVRTLSKARVNGILIPENGQSPVIVKTTPYDGQVEVPVDGEISIAFTFAINPITVNSGSIQVLSEKNGTLPGTFGFDGLFITFYPENDFSYDDIITVTVSTDIADYTGLSLAETFILNFETLEIPEISDRFIENDHAIDTISTTGHFDWCDLDDNGYLDLVIMDGLGYIEIFMNNDGVFEKTATLEAKFKNFVNRGGIRCVDINNDGLIDIFCTGELDSEGHPWAYRFLKNTYSGFQDEILPGLESKIECFDWADINDDGRSDIIISNSDNDNPKVTIYSNDSGKFTNLFSINIDGNGFGSVHWIDYDDDGDPDGIYLPYVDYRNMVFMSNDDGTFSTDKKNVNSDITAYEQFECEAADIDNDDDLDLLIGYTVLYQTENGYEDLLLDHFPRNPETTFFDVDNDGDPDILSGIGRMKQDSLGRNRGYIYIYENINGEFTLSTEHNMNRDCRFRRAEWRDIDNDGRPDLSAITMEGFIIWYNRLPLVTAVEKSNELLPDVIKLASFPNPFNNTVSIEYLLDSPVPVTLEIRNVNGQLVKTIEEDLQTQGLHRNNWDGTDRNGTPVSSGLYFVSVKTPGNTAHTKITLLK